MFITFEGPDGGGKTTQIGALATYLRGQGHDVLTTREPGGTYIGDEVRRLLLDKEGDSPRDAMRPNTELLLFCASRAQLVAGVIRPHLEKGGIVLCDRFADSTYAYQGYGHGLDLEPLRVIVEFATGGLKPDLTLFLDVPPEVGLKRRAEASLFGEEFTRLDGMTLDFHRRVYAGYEKLIAAEPGRWQRLDAAQPVEAIQAQVREIVTSRLAQTQK
jgi:dTMP kinase